MPPRLGALDECDLHAQFLRPFVPYMHFLRHKRLALASGSAASLLEQFSYSSLVSLGEKRAVDEDDGHLWE